jgi:hypothetical protein
VDLDQLVDAAGGRPAGQRELKHRLFNPLISDDQSAAVSNFCMIYLWLMSDKGSGTHAVAPASL